MEEGQEEDAGWQLPISIPPSPYHFVLVYWGNRAFPWGKGEKAKIDPVIGGKTVFELSLLLRNTAGLSSQLSVFSVKNKSAKSLNSESLYYSVIV